MTRSLLSDIGFELMLLVLAKSLIRWSVRDLTFAAVEISVQRRSGKEFRSMTLNGYPTKVTVGKTLRSRLAVNEGSRSLVA
jgi:hypothetical protein